MNAAGTPGALVNSYKIVPRRDPEDGDLHNLRSHNVKMLLLK